MKPVSRAILAVVLVASVLMLAPAATSPVAAATRCTASPDHSLTQARANFAEKCGRTWDASRPDTCDYSSDGFHCHGLTDDVARNGGGSSNRPGTPTASHSTRTGNEVSIRWEPVPGAVGYDIYRDNNYVTTTSADKSTSFWEQGESPMATYNIVAFDGKGVYSKWSESISPSSGVLYLHPLPVDGNKFKFVWTNYGASTHLPVTYELSSVRRPTSRYEPVRERPVATNLTNNNITLTAAPGESFIVRAHVSGYDPVDSIQVVPIPEVAPDKIYAISAGNNTVALVWENSSGAPTAKDHVVYHNGRRVGTVKGKNEFIYKAESSGLGAFQVAPIHADGRLASPSVPVGVPIGQPGDVYAASGTNFDGSLADASDISAEVYRQTESQKYRNALEAAKAIKDPAGTAMETLAGVLAGLADAEDNAPGRDNLKPGSLEEMINEYLQGMGIDEQIPTDEEIAAQLDQRPEPHPASDDLTPEEIIEQVRELHEQFKEDVLALGEQLGDSPDNEELLPAVEKYLQGLKDLGIDTKRPPGSPAPGSGSTPGTNTGGDGWVDRQQTTSSQTTGTYGGPPGNISVEPGGTTRPGYLSGSRNESSTQDEKDDSDDDDDKGDTGTRGDHHP